MKKTILVLIFLITVGTLKAQRDKYDFIRYQTEITLGGAKSTGDLDAPSLLSEILLGARINPYFFAGAGINTNFNFEIGEEISILSCIANFKVYVPTTSEVYPFASLSVGYARGLHAIDDFGGLYLAPGIGINYEFIEDMSLYFMWGYEKISLYDAQNYRINANNTAFKIGYTLVF